MNTEHNNSSPLSDNESATSKTAWENEVKKDHDVEQVEQVEKATKKSPSNPPPPELLSDNEYEDEFILSELLGEDTRDESPSKSQENLNDVVAENELTKSKSTPEKKEAKEINDSEEIEEIEEIEQLSSTESSLTPSEKNDIQEINDVEQIEEVDNSETEENADEDEKAESLEDESLETLEFTESTVLQPLDSKQQINLKQKGDCIHVFLPLTIDSDHNQWQRILTDFQTRLRKIDKYWLPDTKVHLQAQDRLLDTRQIQDLNNIFTSVQLKLDLIVTKRRQTAVAAASTGYSVQQESLDFPIIPTDNEQSNSQELADPLYFNNTILRSGEEICHSSSVIITGDVNPGASIIADGDIIVWGTLKGIAHAGAKGNRKSLIMALKMSPTQIRIADLVARAPEGNIKNPTPEVAYISSEGIRIGAANTFAKTYSFVKQKQCWLNQKDRLNLD